MGEVLVARGLAWLTLGTSLLAAVAVVNVFTDPHVAWVYAACVPALYGAVLTQIGFWKMGRSRS